MTIGSQIATMPENGWLMLNNCPAIHHMMTGIQRAGINAQCIARVQYEDSTESEKPVSDSMKEKESLSLLDFASLFSD